MTRCQYIYYPLICDHCCHQIFLSLIASPLLANADICENITPHHHIQHIHLRILAAELYPLTLFLSSPPSLDYLRCGKLL